ncbi:MAG: hypothetical protein IPK16_03445 [Anaerolineales bacterium]|nr:hypothetical protein [Anaerolineales bacterium]
MKVLRRRILTDSAYRPVFLTGNGVFPLNAYANAITFGLFRFLVVKRAAFAAHHGRVWRARCRRCLRPGDELRRFDPKRLTSRQPFFVAACWPPCVGMFIQPRGHRTGDCAVVVGRLHLALFARLAHRRPVGLTLAAGCGYSSAAHLSGCSGSSHPDGPGCAGVVVAPTPPSGEMTVAVRRRQLTGSVIAAGLALLLRHAAPHLFAQN